MPYLYFKLKQEFPERCVAHALQFSNYEDHDEKNVKTRFDKISNIKSYHKTA